MEENTSNLNGDVFCTDHINGNGTINRTNEKSDLYVTTTNVGMSVIRDEKPKSSLLLWSYRDIDIEIRDTEILKY